MTTSSPPAGWPNAELRDAVGGAFLDGDGHSMKIAKRLFDGTDLRIEEMDGHWVLLASDLDARWGNEWGLDDMARRLLRRINGAVRVEMPSHQTILLTGSYQGHDGEMFHLRSCRRSYEGDPPASFAPSAGGAEYLEQAARVPELDEVLHFMGSPEPLTTIEMWKVYEIIRRHVGGDDPRSAGRHLLATGWLTEDQLRWFKDVINNPEVSGEAARHAVHSPSKDPKTWHRDLDWARLFIANLIKKWRRTL